VTIGVPDCRLRLSLPGRALWPVHGGHEPGHSPNSSDRWTFHNRSSNNSIHAEVAAAHGARRYRIHPCRAGGISRGGRPTRPVGSGLPTEPIETRLAGLSIQTGCSGFCLVSAMRGARAVMIPCKGWIPTALLHGSTTTAALTRSRPLPMRQPRLSRNTLTSDRRKCFAWLRPASCRGNLAPRRSPLALPALPRNS
jgi:hypothetical protein